MYNIIWRRIMKKFYTDDRTVDEINKAYSGKTMGEIQEIENARFKKIQPMIDEKHKEFCGTDRTRMLTVQKLIDYLKTQDPNACILAYEPNSLAYIEQLPGLPSSDVCTVKEDREKQREFLKNWYKDTPNTEQKIEDELAEMYRYAQDNDVIIKFN